MRMDLKYHEGKAMRMDLEKFHHFPGPRAPPRPSIITSGRGHVVTGFSSVKRRAKDHAAPKPRRP